MGDYGREFCTVHRRLPVEIVALLARFGRRQFDTRGGEDDRGDDWAEIERHFSACSAVDPDDFLATLSRTIGRTSGWAAYGAAHTIWRLLQEWPVGNPQYDHVVCAALNFLRRQAVPPTQIKGFEWDHWIDYGGTTETWFDGSRPSLQPARPTGEHFVDRRTERPCHRVQRCQRTRPGKRRKRH